MLWGLIGKPELKGQPPRTQEEFDELFITCLMWFIYILHHNSTVSLIQRNYQGFVNSMI